MANTWNESGSTWSQGDWGQQNVTTISLTGFDLTTSLGTPLAFPEQGWGSDTWGIENWGQSGLDEVITAPSALTSSVGSISPTEMTIGISSAGVATTAVGALDPADVVGLTGLSLSTDVGEITVASVELIDVDGVGATTSVGSVIIETAYLISGQIATSAVGSISPTEMTVGLTGVEATAAVGSVSPLGYFDIDITGNTNYNDIDITGNTSYTDVA